MSSKAHTTSSLSSQQRYLPLSQRSYSYSEGSTTDPSGKMFTNPKLNSEISHLNHISESGSSSVFQGPQIATTGIEMSMGDVVSTSSHGGESFISSGLDFQPLKSYEDTDEQSSVISGLHDVQFDAGYGSMEPFGNHFNNVMCLFSDLENISILELLCIDQIEA